MLLSLNHIKHSFGDVVIFKDFSFDWPANIKNIGVLGPNGSGKTTLFKLISGELFPNDGSILFQDKEITSVPIYKRNRIGIAKTFQIPSPLLGLTVFQNVYLGTVEHEENEKIRIDKTNYLLQKFNLIKKNDIQTDSLNVMECRLLEVARAYATNPKLILLDECMVGFQKSEKQTFMETLSTMQEENPTHIMMIEHDLDVMRTFCDHLLVLSLGEIAISGKSEECLNSDVIRSVYFK